MKQAKSSKQLNKSKLKQEEQLNKAPKCTARSFDLTECLLSCLNQREQDVLKRRYALDGGRKETLESIGMNYQITRERVRQIERASLNKIKKLVDYRKILQNLIGEIDQLLVKYGGVIAHHHLVDELSAASKNANSDPLEVNQEKNHLGFILEEFISDLFHFHKPGKLHGHGWSRDQKIIQSVIETLKRAEEFLIRHSKPVTHDHIARELNIPVDSIYSLLHLSSNIDRNAFGLWGMRTWPQINPKRMADRIYLVLSKYNQPLHYRDLADYITIHYNKKTHPPTVHNELIADPRFVLVGRGIYALTEWGYVSGTVKDIVESILGKSDRTLTREEIVEQVQKQRLVARSTILLAINSNKNIKKVGGNKYELIKTN